MSEKKVSLEIITPEKMVLHDHVDFVVLPGYEGEIGVFSGHTHLLVQMKAGELRITKDNQTDFFAVSGGFAEIHPDQVSVFAETAEMAEEINVERARLAAQKAKENLSQVETAQEMENQQAALRRALIRLRISEALSKKQSKPK